jgi:(1->4)-alpha-D-glucan 1-alpha-D-glucosylmutase
MAEDAITGPKIPISTYRLQFNGAFRFQDAEKIIPYLFELGITDVYASPYFKATRGSLHGYDIVDFSQLNPEVGTEEDLQTFARGLTQIGMGQILDIVPNHMSCGSENRWWTDVLENGPGSPYSDFFDIDWHPAVKKLSGKLLIPILGEQYGKVLENRELKLVFEEGAFFISYHEQKFPLRPETYTPILEHRLEELRTLFHDENPHLMEFLSIITALKHLSEYAEEDKEKIDERYREKEIIKKRLSALCSASGDIREFIEKNVAIYNGVKGEPGSFDLLDGLLARQIWRLSHWRVATEEINYRRFFDINNISALRMEDPAVFAAAHVLALRLIQEKKVTGLRVDHPDGLYNPSEYFHRLQRACFTAIVSRHTAQNNAPPDHTHSDKASEVLRRHEELAQAEQQYRPFYIIGEKILMKGEKMPEDWPVFGTTGYVFLNSVNSIFVESGNARAFDNLYAGFTGNENNFQEVAYEKKKLVMQVAMSGEINTLGHYLSGLAERNRHTRDFTLNSLTKAITEVIAYFPVYRTYIHSADVSDRDRLYIEAAVSKAKRRNRAISASIFDFLGRVLLLRFPEEAGGEDRQGWLDFVMRFQQITSPVMAKGVEDTAFYVYSRLLSLNEVGGSPERFGLPTEAFHGQNLERLKLWPHALVATSTHDTKRGEDVRARINVLSEVPSKWRKCLTRWSFINKKQKVAVEGQAAPDRNEEYLLYQTLIGSWPCGPVAEPEYAEYKNRIKDYMIKALREAKVNTSWISPNAVYEDAVTSFVDAILSNARGNKFLPEFEPFQKTISHFGMLNSLSQTLLKVTSPGVPDFYQGTELWDLNLVDPDNRRQVDFDARRKMLAALTEEAPQFGPHFPGFLNGLLRNWENGAIKLYVILRALTYRKNHHSLFMKGAYIPLACEGGLRDHICAFARQEDERSVLVIVPRLMTSVLQFARDLPLGDKVWGDTAIALPDEIRDNLFTNVLTGEKTEAVSRSGKKVLSAGNVYSCLPVAMLAGEGQ